MQEGKPPTPRAVPVVRRAVARRVAVRKQDKQTLMEQLRQRWGMVMAAALFIVRRGGSWFNINVLQSPSGLWSLLGVVAVVSLINGLIFYQNVQTISEREGWVLHTQTVLTALNRTLVALDDTVTSERGYAVDGNVRYLTDSESSTTTLVNCSQNVANLTVDNPTQQVRINTIKTLITTLQDELNNTVRLRQSGQTTAAVANISVGTEQTTIDQIRDSIVTMNVEEEQLLKTRSLQAQHAVYQTALSFVLGIIETLILLMLVGVAAYKLLLVRERQAAERQVLLEQEHEARTQAENAVQTRDHFLSIASHEMKTPITTMLANLQLLQRMIARGTMNSERVPTMLTMMERQTKRLHLLIEGMLDVSRITSGYFSLNREPIDVVTQVCQIATECKLLAKEQIIAVTAPDERLMVDGDPVRLEQVWYNLIQNAIKYSPNGGTIQVTITASRNAAQIAIADQGLGIVPEAIPHLFERFYRAERTDEHSISGMGVGLFVTHEIVAQHDGAIRVESVEGHGSTFTVTLPLISANGVAVGAVSTTTNVSA